MNAMTAMKIAPAMTPVTAPAITAMLGPEDAEAFVFVLPGVGILVALAAREEARVEPKKGRKAGGMVTVTP